MIPYGRHCVDESDIRAVIKVLESDWLTTGPLVDEFERAVATRLGCTYAVAVSSGTAALHCAMFAAGIESNDEVLLPPMTFAASANSVVYQGGKPVFIDVEADTLLIDPDEIEDKITAKTKAIIAVDYAGQPCDYDRLSHIAQKHNLVLVADACHSLGAEYKKRYAANLADMAVFSFHPVKHITSGEGGMVVTDDVDLADRIRRFRNHGIDLDHRQRETRGSWHYEMADLGFNYRLTDIQSALGMSQLKKLDGFIRRRREIALMYDQAFSRVPGIEPLKKRPEAFHVYHLYVVRLNEGAAALTRSDLFKKLRSRGIGVNVHYIPVHYHPFYKKRYETVVGLCPVAEDAYERIISLPIFPSMSDDQVQRVIQTLTDAVIGVI